MSLTLQEWLSAEPLGSLVFAIIHSLWQAGLCAGLLWLVLRLTPADRSRRPKSAPTAN